MSSVQPARVRKKVEAPPPPVDPLVRKRWWVGGAILGVIAGVLVAVLAVPPIFDHYFGIADIGLGQTYRHGGISFTVQNVSITAAGGRRVMHVDLEVGDRAGEWCPTRSALRLELEGGFRAQPESTQPPLAEPCVPGALTGAVQLVFSFPETAVGEPHILQIDDPKVRLWLQPGEPGE